jgi:hypothetical protein
MPLVDGLDGFKANVDSQNNLQVKLKDSAGNSISKRQRDPINASQESLLIAGKNDDVATIIRTDRKGNIITGNYNPELLENFEGTVLNAQKWVAQSTTFVPAQTTTGGYNFNNTNLLSANAVSILQSQRLFYKHPRIPLQVKLRVRASIGTNSNADFGFGIPTTNNILVPNGIAVRIISGLWYSVLTFNNTELATPIPILGSDGITQLSTANTNSEFYVVDIIVDDDNAIITVQDTTTGEFVGKATVIVPLSSLAMWGATALPTYVRVWNSSVAPSIAPILTLGYIQVLTTDWNSGNNISQLAGLLALSSGRHPFTGAQLENFTNSLAPVSATLSNTAAGYTTLGGKFQFAAPVGAATDYCLFGFTVPVGSRFICEGVVIETYNTVVPVATTPTLFEWGMGFNSVAVSLATANIIRQTVGIQSLAVGAPVGAQANRIDITFDTPEVTESGRILSVILNVPIGTNTATEIFRGIVHVKGRFI